MTIKEISKCKRGDILYLRHYATDAPETIRFVRYDERSGLAIINHKGLFVKGGFENIGYECLISKLNLS